jgi:hypothetical protein
MGNLLRFLGLSILSELAGFAELCANSHFRTELGFRTGLGENQRIAVIHIYHSDLVLIAAFRAQFGDPRQSVFLLERCWCKGHVYELHRLRALSSLLK